MDRVTKTETGSEKTVAHLTQSQAELTKTSTQENALISGDDFVPCHLNFSKLVGPSGQERIQLQCLQKHQTKSSPKNGSACIKFWQCKRGGNFHTRPDSQTGWLCTCQFRCCKAIEKRAAEAADTEIAATKNQSQKGQAAKNGEKQKSPFTLK